MGELGLSRLGLPERTDNTFFYRTPVPPVSRTLRAALYGATVFLSFFLMLVFMTYNVGRFFSLFPFLCPLANDCGV